MFSNKTDEIWEVLWCDDDFYCGYGQRKED